MIIMMIAIIMATMIIMVNTRVKKAKINRYTAKTLMCHTVRRKQNFTAQLQLIF